MYEIRNNFHNTVARTRGGYLSASAVVRIRRQLCGVAGCKCAEGDLGQRGPQTCRIEPTYDRNDKPTAWIGPREDGE